MSKQPASFRSRIVTLTSVFLLFLSAAVAIATAMVSHAQLKNSLFAQGLQWSQSLAENSVTAVLYQNSEIIKNTVNAIMATGKVTHIALNTKQGNIVLEQGAVSKDQTAQGYQYAMTGQQNLYRNQTIQETDDYWVFNVNIVTKNPIAAGTLEDEDGFINSSLQNETTEEIIGHLHLTLSKQSMNEASRRIFLSNLSIAIILSMILIFLLRKVSQRMFLPLENLSDIMQQTSRGEWQAADEHRGSREIVQISNSYNDMINALRQRDDELVRTNINLEKIVAQRTEALEESNEQLNAFNYSVSHDLRAPLRSIDGFSKLLLQDYEDSLDEQGRDYLHRVRRSTIRMGMLIDDLLKLSRLSQRELAREDIELSAIAEEILEAMLDKEPDRKTEITLHKDLYTHADPGLAWIVIENLISNAWKYSRNAELTYIELGRVEDMKDTFYLKDRGTGFDMKYAGKLFAPFQRLHSDKQFEGTGIGLATIKRIIDKHNGRVWVESEPDMGTSFYFSFSASIPDTDSGSDPETN